VAHCRLEPVDGYVGRLAPGGYDVVIDTVGGRVLADSLRAARDGGTVVTLAAQSAHDLTTAQERGLTLHCVQMLLALRTSRGRARCGEALQRLGALLDDGRLRPLYDPEVFGFYQVAAAHVKLQLGEHLGRIRLVACFG
jgi:NADPH2:quinone reductase